MSTTLTVVGITSLLFAIVNLGALAVLQVAPVGSLENNDDILSEAISPQSPEGQEILRSAYGEPAAARVAEAVDNTQAPAFAAHPVLHYILQPTSNAYYTVGREGIRYLGGWTDEGVGALLASARRKVFLMGGSTTFGHGLGNDETIAAHLQRQLGDGYAVFNFGTAAYDQIREIDRLLYHLRQGHRPDVVIFLDGLNDAFTFARSHYRLEDKLVYHGFVSGRGSLVGGDRPFALDTERSLSASDFLVRLAYALPATRLVLERTRPQPRLDTTPIDVDSFQSPLDYETARYVFFQWAAFADAYRPQLVDRAREYYGRNLPFLQRLAAAFGFRLLVFYQPNGYLDAGNPMRGQVSEDTPGYRYLADVQEAVRAAIRSSQLPMIDITGVLAPLSGQKRAYIDAEHYSPAANDLIALTYGRYILASP